MDHLLPEETDSRYDKSLLLKTARAVFNELEPRAEGTSLQLVWPYQIGRVDTGGWRAYIGGLGKGQPRLQIWLDLYTGYESRKFNFCFYLNDRAKMRRFAERASKQLPVHRVLTEDDFERDGFAFLSKRLRRNEFGPVILEEYFGKYCFYGIYDITVRSGVDCVNPSLCARAAAFFESVARTMPKAKPESEDREAYSQVENRKVVVSHLQRERSRLLAAECKIRDNYECQVCELRFEDVYGDFGKGFAEAHHRVPLHRLNGKVKTRVEDLATVCGNCHRMLHRMDGKRTDVETLRAVFRKRTFKRR